MRARRFERGEMARGGEKRRLGGGFARGFADRAQKPRPTGAGFGGHGDGVVVDFRLRIKIDFVRHFERFGAGLGGFDLPGERARRRLAAGLENEQNDIGGFGFAARAGDSQGLDFVRVESPTGGVDQPNRQAVDRE